MPNQDYKLYTANAYEGDAADTTQGVRGTGIVEDPTLDFGVAVKRGNLATNDRHILKGSDAGKVYAITLRELSHEAANRPSDGTTVYNTSESASIMREGYIYVKLVNRASVAGTALGVTAAGVFEGDADNSGVTLCTNVFAEETAPAGTVIRARIDIKD